MLYSAAALALASSGYGCLSFDRALGLQRTLRHPVVTTLALRPASSRPTPSSASATVAARRNARHADDQRRRAQRCAVRHARSRPPPPPNEASAADARASRARSSTIATSRSSCAPHDLLVVDEPVIDPHVGDARRERRAKEVQRALDVADEVRVAERAGALGKREPFGAQPGGDQRRLGGLDQRALQRRRARPFLGVASFRQRARLDDARRRPPRRAAVPPPKRSRSASASPATASASAPHRRVARTLAP